jgi:hypothetical protein
LNRAGKLQIATTEAIAPDRMVRAFLGTAFAQKIAKDYKSRESRAAWKLDAPPWDVELGFSNESRTPPLHAHQDVLSSVLPLFHLWFMDLPRIRDEPLNGVFPFIFSDVVHTLARFCYLMVGVSFDLDVFLEGVDYGHLGCDVLLLAGLTYLGESQLCARVRQSLAVNFRPPNQGRIVPNIQLIQNSFRSSDEDLIYVQHPVQSLHH